MNDSIFFDSGLPPPTNNNGYNFPGAWEGYSLWQKYLMSKNCKSAELAQQRVECQADVTFSSDNFSHREQTELMPQQYSDLRV